MNKFVLPKLSYSYDALEPFIDARTMEIHHTKHHQAYVDKLNMALEGRDEFLKMDIKELMKNIKTVPESIRQAVINNGGGHANHSFFWEVLKKSVPIKGMIKDEIEKAFGSFENFRSEFSRTLTPPYFS